MKTVVTRYIAAAIVAVSIGFLLFYFLQAPAPAISTYYQLDEFMQQEEYVNFSDELSDMATLYPTGGAINATFTNIKQALDNNFNYYNTYLLFVKEVTQVDQQLIDQKISYYNTSLQESYRLLTHFNQNFTSEPTVNAGMHQNFVNAYKTQITRYLELIETLKTYVIEYAFDKITPVGLKQTLLQVQLDYAKVMIENNYAYTYLLSELTLIKTKYANFLNNPQGNDAQANNFIFAYENFENVQQYIKSSAKLAYVNGYPEGTQATYAQTIHDFITQNSYN